MFYFVRFFFKAEKSRTIHTSIDNSVPWHYSDGSVGRPGLVVIHITYYADI